MGRPARRGLGQRRRRRRGRRAGRRPRARRPSRRAGRRWAGSGRAGSPAARAQSASARGDAGVAGDVHARRSGSRGRRAPRPRPRSRRRTACEPPKTSMTGASGGRPRRARAAARSRPPSSRMGVPVTKRWPGSCVARAPRSETARTRRQPRRRADAPAGDRDCPPRAATGCAGSRGSEQDRDGHVAAGRVDGVGTPAQQQRAGPAAPRRARRSGSRSVATERSTVRSERSDRARRAAGPAAGTSSPSSPRWPPIQRDLEVSAGRGQRDARRPRPGRCGRRCHRPR